MHERLQAIIDDFQWADMELRLQMLIDFSNKLTPLPARYTAQRDAGLGRVQECQTPVFIYLEITPDQKLLFHADVAPEAPTIRGLVSIIQHVVHGLPVASVRDLPNDLIARLGLDTVIRMNRALGVTAVLNRIKQQIASATALKPGEVA